MILAGLGRALRPALFGLVTALLAGSLAAVVAPLVAAPVAAPARADASYGAPSWWNGDCDTVNWTAKARAAGWTGEAARRLGGVVLGIPVCGPRNLAGAPNIWWSRPGWGELEWQCVEFAQRFMIQVYGTQPYQANGVDVVRNYTTARGGGLVRVDNGTVGKAPAPGDIVSFSSPSNVYGHVAVVASSTVDAQGNGSVRLATQNDTVDGWRTLAVSNWQVAAFGSLYPYAWLHDPQGRGGGSATDGSYVQYRGAIYRLVGGAPVYVSTWANVGGAKSFFVLDDAQFAALRSVPRDGTFLRDASSGAIYRTVSGAPVHVTDCSAATLAGCTGWLDVDPVAIARAGDEGYYAHLRATVPDGALLRRADGAQRGWIGVGVGASLVHVTDCGPYSGCAGYVDVDTGGIDQYLAAHPAPVDGTIGIARPSGTLWGWTAGVCHSVSGSTAQTPVPINDGTLTCLSPITVAQTPSAGLVVGRVSRATVSAAGGSGSLSWSLQGGTLPAGLVLTSTGQLVGTPTSPGTSSIVVTVTDTAYPDSWAAATVVLNVVGPPVVATTTVPTLVVGQPIDIAVAATGGAGPLSWAVTGGRLPAGLTLRSDGHLMGAPTAVGDRAVVLQVTDASSPVQRVSVSLVVSVVPAGGLEWSTGD